MKTIRQKKRHNKVALSLLIMMIITAFISCDSDDNGTAPMEFPMATSDELIPLPFFVKAENGNSIDPTSSDAKTLLITDLGRKPIMSPESTQVTWGEWSKVEGSILVECTQEGTRVTLHLRGLIPNGVYTIWNVTFKAPGFTGEFDGPALPSHVKAFGPLGPKAGNKSGFTASESGEGSISATTPFGALGSVGEIGACALTDELEWHVVGLYHIDGETHGPVRGPDGTHAEQFAFIFKNAE